MSAALGDRTLFPDLAARSYLAHCAVAPASTPVRAAVERALTDYARLGMGAVAPWLAERQELRAALARLIGAEHPEDVALTTGTTAGIVALAQCLPWRAGDAVVVLRGEFPTNVTPWLQAARQHDLTVRWLDADDFRPDGPGLDRLQATLADGRVRLVAVSAVQFQTGLAMPLAAMAAQAHAHGAALFVDAIQAAGVLPIDVAATHIDYLACGAHKWIGGIEGAGFVYVAPQHVANLRPTVAGWLSHEDPVSFLFAGPGVLRYDRPIRERADFLEAGSLSTVGLAALGAAVAQLEALGVAAIAEHVSAFHARVAPTLAALGFTDGRPREARARSGIFAARPPADLDPQAVRLGLAERGVVVTAPEGWLRLGPHWSTPLAEAELFSGALREVCATLRG